MHVVCIYTPGIHVYIKYTSSSQVYQICFLRISLFVFHLRKIPYSWVSKNRLSERLKFCSVHLSSWSLCVGWFLGLYSILFCLSAPLSTLSLHSLYKCLAPLRLTVFCSFPCLLVWLLVVLESNLTKSSQLLGKCFIRYLHPRVITL